MNITKHFLERYVERIVEIDEVKSYIAMNKDMLEEHILKTFEHSEKIYRGQIGDNITRNYYIKDDIVMISNTTDDALITVYKVDLGFTDELNKTVRQGLIEEIRSLTQSKEAIDGIVYVSVDKINNEIDNIDEEIKLLNKKIEILKSEKEFKKEEINQHKSKSLNAGLDIKKYTLMLVNSKDYKKDLTELK